MSQDLIIGIAGAGGDGVISAGESLLTAAPLEGYHGIMTKSFGSQIHGGEASCRLRLATQPVLNPNGPLNVAVALNWEDFRHFGWELPMEPFTIVVYESDTGIPPDDLPLEGVTPAVVFRVPITKMAEQNAGTDIEEGLRFPGFAFINVQSPCVTYGEEDHQLKAQKARFQTLESIGHDPADRALATERARAYGTKPYTGILYRNPNPPPTYGQGVAERQQTLKKLAVPRHEILKRFMPIN
jgi:hypothetical protein